MFFCSGFFAKIQKQVRNRTIASLLNSYPACLFPLSIISERTMPGPLLNSADPDLHADLSLSDWSSDLEDTKNAKRSSIVR
jgi:hypothetical protein